MITPSRHHEVLVVEGRPADAQLTHDAFIESGLPIQVHVVGSGEEALAFLRRRPPFGAAPRPDLLVVDLTLPLMSGFELLSSLRVDDSLRRIPAVVMSTADDDDTVRRCYDLSASTYLLKSGDWLDFSQQIRALANYWFQVARLPAR